MSGKGTEEQRIVHSGQQSQDATVTRSTGHQQRWSSTDLSLTHPAPPPDSCPSSSCCHRTPASASASGAALVAPLQSPAHRTVSSPSPSPSLAQWADPSLSPAIGTQCADQLGRGQHNVCQIREKKRGTHCVGCHYQGRSVPHQCQIPITQTFILTGMRKQTDEGNAGMLTKGRNQTDD